MGVHKRNEHVFNNSLKQTLTELSGLVQTILDNENAHRANHGAAERAARLQKLISNLKAGLNQPAFDLTVEKSGNPGPVGDLNSTVYGRAKEQLVLGFRQFLTALQGWETLAAGPQRASQLQHLHTACLQLRLDIVRWSETAVDLEAEGIAIRNSPANAAIIAQGKAYLLQIRNELIELIRRYDPGATGGSGNGAVDAVITSALAEQSTLLQGLKRNIEREKSLHDSLLKGATPLTAADRLAEGKLKEAASAWVLGGYGYVTNKAFNPSKKPELSIWKRAEDLIEQGQADIVKTNVIEAAIHSVQAQAHYARAMRVFYAWKDGIEVAGTRTQIAIGAIAVIVVVGAVVIYTRGGVLIDIGKASTATQATGQGKRVVEVVEKLRVPIEQIIEATTPEEMEFGEEGVKKALRSVVPSVK